MNVERINTLLNIKNFGKKPISVQEKENKLEQKGIFPPYSTIISRLDDKRYERALYLISKGVDFKSIKALTDLDNQKYKQAVHLLSNGVFDSNLLDIAKLERDNYKKAVDYQKQGLNTDCLKLFAELTEEELKTAQKLMGEDGYPPHIAGNLAKLSEQQRQIAIKLLDSVEIDIACDIAKTEQPKREKCINYLEQGIKQDFVTEISELNEEEEKRLPEIFSYEVGDINITDFAKMSEKEYTRAKELLYLGVNPNAIYDIILIEKGEGENEEYTEYRNRGYSYSTSASLSALNDVQIEALEKLIKLHPEIRDLFKEEYEISVIQLQTDDVQEAILTRNMRTEDGTKITLVQTFDGYGDKTQSRLETYKDKSTSSYLKNQTGVFIAKYDKYGQIKELIEHIQDFETKEVTGIVHTKASPILIGAYESKYYDIDDFKSSNNGTPDCSIEESVLSEGIPLSSIKQNNDGSITYEEDFQLNEYQIERSYKEKKDDNGKIIDSYYSYKITSAEDDEVLMNISRSFKKNDNNTTTNTINGIEYHINYNDETKKITITDGKNTKTLNFGKILPEFSQNIMWEVIKQLHVDTLLTINKNIKKWQYTEECNSLVDEYNKIISTGTNINIITHEVGHIIANQNQSIFTNDDLIQTYGQEMDTFKINMPYNEQEFIQYFSQRAELQETDGLSEFIAETNAILTSYGINYKGLNTRAQFLIKYFPRSIVKVAELLGKTSTKSLLE